MIKFLEGQGLRVVRIVGLITSWTAGGKLTTVPVHGNRNLKIGTLRAILRDVDVSPDEFARLWSE